MRGRQDTEGSLGNHSSSGDRSLFRVSIPGGQGGETAISALDSSPHKFPKHIPVAAGFCDVERNKHEQEELILIHGTSSPRPTLEHQDWPRIDSLSYLFECSVMSMAVMAFEGLRSRPVASQVCRRRVAFVLLMASENPTGPVLRRARMVCSWAPTSEWSGGHPFEGHPPRIGPSGSLLLPAVPMLAEVQNVSLEGRAPNVQMSIEDRPISQLPPCEAMPEYSRNIKRDKKSTARKYPPRVMG